MEAVTHNAFGLQRAGQGEAPRHGGHGAVERGIETCHLNQTPVGGSNLAHRGNVERHVDRVERHQPVQYVQHLRRHQARCRINRPAMNHPVPNGENPIMPGLTVDAGEQLAQHSRETLPAGPGALQNNVPFAVMHGKPRRLVKPACLAVQEGFILREHRELKARRARIQNQDRSVAQTSESYLDCRGRTRRLHPPAACQDDTVFVDCALRQ